MTSAPNREPVNCFRRTLAVCLLAGGVATLAATRAPSTSAVPVPVRLGEVVFPASGLAAAHPHFIRGIAALHSFWYEEALEAFQTTLRVDPDFPMAWWGVGMAFNRPFVPGSDDERGRRALANIRDPATITPRERAYIDALRRWYADGTVEARARAYAVAMRKIHLDYPDDLEAAAFYALSLLGQGWPDEDRRSRHLAAAAIAGEVYRRRPNHPGAAHYLIHSYDEPELAVRGLEAARHYAAIAPDAPHALHMPSHIFLQLGMWRDTTASNEAAWAASEAWVQRKALGPMLRDYHNLHWLIYSSLQQGRYAKAAELVEQFRAMRKDLQPEMMFFLEKAVAAFVVETRNWDRADELFSAPASDPLTPTPGKARAQVSELCGAEPERRVVATALQPADIPAFIRTLAAAARGAPDSEQRLDELRARAGGDASMPEFWRIRVLEIAAVNRANRKDFDGAISAMREATAIEEELGKPPGPPAAYKPPHELFGEILLRAGKASAAAAQFNQNLLLHPNRALSLLGRARAEAAMGHTAASCASYLHFLQIWQHADPHLPEIREARDFVNTNRS